MQVFGLPPARFRAGCAASRLAAKLAHGGGKVRHAAVSYAPPVSTGRDPDRVP